MNDTDIKHHSKQYKTDNHLAYSCQYHVIVYSWQVILIRGSKKSFWKSNKSKDTMSLVWRSWWSIDIPWTVGDYQLQKFVEYKAKLQGIIVEYIDPRYTSITCSRCGHIDNRNREEKKFECLNGHVDHGDVTASFNIGKPISRCVVVSRDRFSADRLNTLKGNTGTPKVATLGNDSCYTAKCNPTKDSTFTIDVLFVIIFASYKQLLVESYVIGAFELVINRIK
jgi:hypothetical protein